MMASGATPIVLRVGSSVSGAVFDVPLVSSDLVVDELREELARRTDIPPREQILLCGPPFARLDPRRALASYGLPAPDKRIFLYDRRMLAQEHAVGPRVALEPVEIEAPSLPIPTSESSRMLSESVSPLVRAFGDYQSHFQLQFGQSEALERGSAANADVCGRCVDEMQVQADAIAAAIANVETFRVSMTKHFGPFWADYREAAAKHERLLANFDSDLAALGDVQLHPAFVTPTRETLLDCIPVDREREWASQCEQSHRRLAAQVERLKKVHDEIVDEVGSLVLTQDQFSAAFGEATASLDRMNDCVRSHRTITDQLAANLEIVTKRITEVSAEIQPQQSMAASSRMLEFFRGIDELFHGQHEMLPSAEKLAQEVKDGMSSISAAKASIFMLVHSSLRRISVSQSKIRDFENSLELLKAALSTQKKHFDELEHLAKLPESYERCIKEISRRLKYGKAFSDKIQSMAEELAQLRDDEVHHREVFLRNYGQHLPRDFVPGLAEKPSHCEFRMRPFDQSLPQIVDESDEGQDQVSDGALSPCRTSTGSKEEFFDTHVGEEIPSITGSADIGDALEVDLLQKRCEELETRVAELTLELQQSKKESSYFSGSCGSIARSDASKASAREGDSSCEFPLVLALAATAGGMTSSSEADRSNLLEKELHSIKTGKGDFEAIIQEKNGVIAKLERENKEYLLNAAAFEEYPFDEALQMQERTRREQSLQASHTKQQEIVRALQLSLDLQRSSWIKVFKLLDFPPSLEREAVETEEGVSSLMERVEGRIRQLVASADTETVLREELERRHEEINMLESQHIEITDPYKISFRQFEVNDLALFLPTSAPGSDAQRVYLAFHHGCPHRFLSEESISSFMIGGRKYPDYVVGRIVFIDEQVATEHANPYGLHVGTTFYVLTVASLQDT